MPDVMTHSPGTFRPPDKARPAVRRNSSLRAAMRRGRGSESLTNYVLEKDKYLCNPPHATVCPEGQNYFLGFAFANGDGALPALIAAQRRRAASAIAFRPAALSLRRGAEDSRAVDSVGEDGEAGRRLSVRLGPCRASIARDGRSRSVISKATICSVCID